MIDPETTRQTAHVLLDAAAVLTHDADEDTRDDMVAVAFQRLGELQSIRLTEDGSLDIRRFSTAALLVVHGLIGMVVGATEGKLDEDAIIATLREQVDDMTDEATP